MGAKGDGASRRIERESEGTRKKREELETFKQSRDLQASFSVFPFFSDTLLALAC